MTFTAPPFFSGNTGLLITAFQVLIIFTAFKNETNPVTRMAYSKFAGQSKKTNSTTSVMVSSRIGMLIIYSPAFIYSAFVTLISFTPSLFFPTSSPTAILCAIHFAKRDLEVLFVHNYSGSVELSLSIQIGLFYLLGSALMCCAGETNPTPLAQRAGSVLFTIGIFGNFYHHFLLAGLRISSAGESTKNKEYICPRGGMFEYVATPHYLFELIGWLGIAIVAWHGNAFLFFMGMCSYLGGRSWAQHDWNKTNFGKEWPVLRKSLIPFVF